MLLLSEQQLTDAFGLNAHLILRHVADLTHAESLIQPPYHHNCLNWVLGHILHSRDQMLRLLGAEAGGNADALERYKRGSDPITQDGPDVMPLAALLATLEDRQSRLATALNSADSDKMATKIDAEDTVGSALFLLYFHECYHTGQIDQLRQVAGKNDTIIK